jgi:hypothetical protein
MTSVHLYCVNLDFDLSRVFLANYRQENQGSCAGQRFQMPKTARMGSFGVFAWKILPGAIGKKDSVCGIYGCFRIFSL